jgi:hypothetical protein
MNRFKATLAIAAFSLFALTACGGEAAKVTEGAQKAGEGAMKATTEGAQKAGEGAMKAGEGAMKATTESAMGLMSLKDSIPGLKDSAAAALTAAKTGDFKTAQEEVTKLKGSWEKVGAIVKTHSAGNYDKINSTLKTVQTELKAPSPDKAKIVADLQSLSTNVTGLVAVK